MPGKPKRPPGSAPSTLTRVTPAAVRDLRRGERSPEQQERFEKLSERQALIQERGIPKPADGLTYGAKAASK